MKLNLCNVFCYVTMATKECLCLRFRNIICLQVVDTRRLVVSDLATDVIVHIGEVRFYLHKVSVLVFSAIFAEVNSKHYICFYK